MRFSRRPLKVSPHDSMTVLGHLPSPETIAGQERGVTCDQLHLSLELRYLLYG